MSAAEDMFGLAALFKVVRAQHRQKQRLRPLLQTLARSIYRARTPTYKDYIKYKVSALSITVAFLHITYLEMENNWAVFTAAH